MFYYPRFAGFFDDPFYGRRRRRRRDLFDTDPFMNFFGSSDEEEGEEEGGFYYPFYERRRIAPRRRRERRRKKEKEEKKEKEKSEKKKEENSVKKQKQIDPLSLFFRDFGNAYPFWLNEFYDEKKKERKEEKEEKKDDEIQKDEKEKKDEKVKMEPISYKRIKTFSSINGKTESKEIVEDSRSGTKKEIHSKLIGDKMLTIVKKTTKEGKEEVLKKCEGIDSEEEFMKLWKANEQETKAIPEKKKKNKKLKKKNKFIKSIFQKLYNT